MGIHQFANPMRLPSNAAIPPCITNKVIRGNGHAVIRVITKAVPNTKIPPRTCAARAKTKGIRLCAAARCPADSGISKAAIGALRIQQRAACIRVFDVFNPADKNNVVAAFKNVDASAFQIG